MTKAITLFLLFPCIVFTRLNAYSQTITTVAGSGIAGFSGDGGPALSAEIMQPYNVSFDGSGNMYIADGNNNRVRKVNSAGIITTFAGNGYGAPYSGGYSGDGGLADSAELYYPSSIAIDDSGNVYIADAGNNVIRKVNQSGIITTFAGNGTAGYSGDGGPADSAELLEPAGIAFDGSGNLYIATFFNSRIRKVSPSGIISTFVGTGTSGYSGDGGPATSAELNNPSGIAFDGSSGNMYIADSYNNVIRKVSPSGVISTIAGNGITGYSGDGGDADSAALNYPYGVAVDNASDIYIADYGNSRVRKVSPSGIITTYAGTGVAGYSGDHGPANDAELNSPYGVTVTGDGVLYVSDYFNQRVRSISAPPMEISESVAMWSTMAYPNPTTGTITIPVNHEISNVALYDVYGRTVEVKNTVDNASDLLLNLSGLPCGTYILKVQNGNKCDVQKIIRE